MNSSIFLNAIKKKQTVFSKCCCHISISIKVTFKKIINMNWLLKEKKKNQLYIKSKFSYHIHKHDKYVHDKYMYIIIINAFSVMNKKK